MERIFPVGDDEKFHTFHRLGLIQLSDQSRAYVLKLKRTRSRSHIAVNCSALGEAVARYVRFVLVDDRERLVLMNIDDFRELLDEEGEVRDPRNGAYWLLDHTLLPEEREVELGPRVLEEPPTPKPKVEWSVYEYQNEDRALVEVGQALGLPTTFYNPTTSRMLKELPQFDLIMIDRADKKVWLGRKL